MAQSAVDEQMDVSKPTNFYTLLDNNLEFTSTENANIFGYRANFTYSISPKHLLLLEAPLLYNDNTNKFGIGDLRVRYFWLPYKNYEKVFGAFGPSVDIFAPTGNFENGLGTGRWIIAPGITAALMVADWIQFFPVLSYQYVSKNITDLVPDQINEDKHGMSFQIITPIVLSKKVFIQLTPVLSYSDFKDNKSFGYAQELLFSYGIKKTLWVNLFYRGDFKNEIHTIRLGLTMYL
jgi:hypothetical protein